MSSIFCCSSISPYRPKLINGVDKVNLFIEWAELQDHSKHSVAGLLVSPAHYVIRVVTTVKLGPTERIRYFFPRGDDMNFEEVSDDELVNYEIKEPNPYVIMTR